MATSGQVNTNTAYDSYFWVKWSQSGDQDIPNNRTLIDWSCGVYCGHSFYSNAIKMSAVSINGSQVYGGGTYSNYSSGNHTIASGTMWIGHNTDGAKTFAISSFTGWLYSSYDYSASATTHTLTQIPRKATITAAADFTDTGNPSLSFSNPGGFTMDVWLEPNPVGDHLCVRKGIPNTGKYTWTLTDAERDKLRNKCAGKTSCQIRLGLYSYIGGVSYASYVDKTYTITENTATKPSVSISVSPNNSGLPGMFAGLYVQGKSRARVSISASGKYGASISSYSSTVDGKAYTSASFDATTSSAGTKTITGYAKDSRGFTNSASARITIIPYSAPQISSFSVERQADGTTVVAHLKGAISSVENKNTKTFSVTLNGETKTGSASAYNVDETVTFTDVPTDATLTATAKVSDAFSTVTKEAVVPTVDVTMDFHHSGKGVAFGKVAEHENLLDVDWDIKYKGGIISDFVVEQGTSGVWTYRKWNSGTAELWGYGTAAYENVSVLGKELTYPFTLTSALCGIGTLNSYGSNAAASLQWNLKLAYGASACKIWVHNASGGFIASSTLDASVYIMGRWK